MKITVVGTNFTGWNWTYFSELCPQVDVTYIQEEKMNTLKNDRPLINRSIEDLLQNHKPPNVIV